MQPQGPLYNHNGGLAFIEGLMKGREKGNGMFLKSWPSQEWWRTLAVEHLRP